MKHTLPFPLLLLLHGILLFTSCGKADGPVNVIQEEPGVQELTVNPSSLHFTGTDGVKDTTITFHISARSNHSGDYTLTAQIASMSDREELESVTLQPVEGEQEEYSGTIPLETRTIQLQNSVIYVTPYGPQNYIGNRAETTITVTWSDTGNPEVLEINHPEELTIPAAGEPDKSFFVTATVNHTFSLDFIDQVTLELHDAAFNLLSTFSMSDEHDNYDTTSGDGIYVQGFSIDSQTNPATFIMKVHAVDFAGTSSDTLQSPITFVPPEDGTSESTIEFVP